MATSSNIVVFSSNITYNTTQTYHYTCLHIQKTRITITNHLWSTHVTIQAQNLLPSMLLRRLTAITLLGTWIAISMLGVTEPPTMTMEASIHMAAKV